MWTWPSGLRRRSKVPVRKSVGSNPTVHTHETREVTPILTGDGREREGVALTKSHRRCRSSTKDGARVDVVTDPSGFLFPWRGSGRRECMPGRRGTGVRPARGRSIRLPSEVPPSRFDLFFLGGIGNRALPSPEGSRFPSPGWLSIEDRSSEIFVIPGRIERSPGERDGHGRSHREGSTEGIDRNEDSIETSPDEAVRSLGEVLGTRFRMATRGRFARQARVFHVSEASVPRDERFLIVRIAWNRIGLTRWYLRSPRKPVVNVPPLAGMTNVSDRTIWRESYSGILLDFSSKRFMLMVDPIDGVVIRINSHDFVVLQKIFVRHEGNASKPPTLSRPSAPSGIPPTANRWILHPAAPVDVRVAFLLGGLGAATYLWLRGEEDVSTVHPSPGQRTRERLEATKRYSERIKRDVVDESPRTHVPELEMIVETGTETVHEEDGGNGQMEGDAPAISSSQNIHGVQGLSVDLEDDMVDAMGNKDEAGKEGSISNNVESTAEQEHMVSSAELKDQPMEISSPAHPGDLPEAESPMERSSATDEGGKREASEAPDHGSTSEDADHSHHQEGQSSGEDSDRTSPPDLHEEQGADNHASPAGEEAPSQQEIARSPHPDGQDSDDPSGMHENKAAAADEGTEEFSTQSTQELLKAALLPLSEEDSKRVVAAFKSLQKDQSKAIVKADTRARNAVAAHQRLRKDAIVALQRQGLQSEAAAIEERKARLAVIDELRLRADAMAALLQQHTRAAKSAATATKISSVAVAVRDALDNNLDPSIVPSLLADLDADPLVMAIRDELLIPPPSEAWLNALWKETKQRALYLDLMPPKECSSACSQPHNENSESEDMHSHDSTSEAEMPGGILAQGLARLGASLKVMPREDTSSPDSIEAHLARAEGALRRGCSREAASWAAMAAQHANPNVAVAVGPFVKAAEQRATWEQAASLLAAHSKVVAVAQARG